MKTILLILAASLLVTAFSRAVMRLVRANREEQTSDYSDNLIPPCGPVGPITDIPRTDKVPGFGGSIVFRDGRDMPPIELGKLHWIPLVKGDSGPVLIPEDATTVRFGIGRPPELPSPMFSAAFREVVEGEEPPPKLNPDLPPMDFGELPDVTDGAGESAAKVLSEPPPKGEVA